MLVAKVRQHLPGYGGEHDARSEVLDGATESRSGWAQRSHPGTNRGGGDRKEDERRCGADRATHPIEPIRPAEISNSPRPSRSRVLLEPQQLR